VTVTPEKTTVDYVLAVKPGDEQDGRRNGQVAFAYSIGAAGHR